MEVAHRPLTAYVDGIAYTYADNTFSANLDYWKILTKFKVLIKNDDKLMNSEATQYGLQVANTTAGTFANVNGAFIIGPTWKYPEIRFGSTNHKGITGGVQESDGIAFYYSNLIATDADIEFTLLETGVS